MEIAEPPEHHPVDRAATDHWRDGEHERTSESGEGDPGGAEKD